MVSPSQYEPLNSLLSDLARFTDVVNAKYVLWQKSFLPSEFVGAVDFTNEFSIDANALYEAFAIADGRASIERCRTNLFLQIYWTVGKPLTEISLERLEMHRKLVPVTQASTAFLNPPSFVFAVKQIENGIGSSFNGKAEGLLCRLAEFLLNVDGPPPPQSRKVYEQYKNVLANAGPVVAGILERARRASAEGRSRPKVEMMTKEYNEQAGTLIVASGPISPPTTLKPSNTFEELLLELNGLVGLAQIKRDVQDLANYIKVQQLRRAKGLRSPDISLHMVFHGNPGTGKTSVARLLSKIYKALGVISKGHLVETDRSGLVAGYVGQTALKARKVANEALGGILFIDEAYALRRNDDPQDFGNEAIETLLKFMEDNRQDLVVIVAGYPVEMKRFLDANPGLQSRFNKSLNFPDYTAEELHEIFLRLCRDADYKLTESAKLRLSDYFQIAYKERDSKFGNARLARNVFEKAITQVANRVIQSADGDSSSLELIQESDIESVIGSQ